MILVMNALAAHVASPVLVVLIGMAVSLVLGSVFGSRTGCSSQGAHRAVHRHAGHPGHLSRLSHLVLQRRRDHARRQAVRRLRPGLLRQLAGHSGADLGLCSGGAHRRLHAQPHGATGATCKRSDRTNRWRVMRRWLSTAEDPHLRAARFVRGGGDHGCMCLASARHRRRPACCGSSKRSPR